MNVRASIKIILMFIIVIMLMILGVQFDVPGFATTLGN